MAGRTIGIYVRSKVNINQFTLMCATVFGSLLCIRDMKRLEMIVAEERLLSGKDSATLKIIMPYFERKTSLCSNGDATLFLCTNKFNF